MVVLFQLALNSTIPAQSASTSHHVFLVSSIVVNTKSERKDEPGAQEGSLLAKHSTDIWNAAEALFIQDGPFLVVRLTVMTHFNVFHQMLGFFAIKNFLVVILNLYRLTVICQDFRASSGSRRETPVLSLSELSEKTHQYI